MLMRCVVLCCAVLCCAGLLWMLLWAIWQHRGDDRVRVAVCGNYQTALAAKILTSTLTYTLVAVASFGQIVQQLPCVCVCCVCCL